MTPQDEDPAHAELGRLFDATAREASGPTLTKLGARARDIPQQATRKSGLLPRWAWGPVFGVFTLAAGALLALRGAHPPAKSAERAAAAQSAATPPWAVATGSNAAEVVTRAPEPAPGEELSDNAELSGDLDDGAHFDVSGPQSDRDLDAWLAATKDLSGGT